MSTESHIIVCYPQKEPVLAVVNEDNFVKAVSELCNGFEIVCARGLRSIHESAVFICCDDFIRLDDPKVNRLATMLYNDYAYEGFDILGTICIVKEVAITYGETSLCGFTQKEAEALAVVLNEVQRIWKEDACDQDEN